MSTVRGCEFPDDLYYLVDKHVWLRPAPDGLVRVGLTPIGFKLLRNSLVAISIRTSAIDQEIPKGKSVAMVESVKYIGPLAAPLTGVLVRGNDRVTNNPDLAVNDPYGEGWIVEMRPVDWEGARGELLTGAEATAAIQDLMESQGLSC
jgi:glycine cleavage system H protein